MGNGNGSAGVLYELVDDVREIKGKMSSYDRDIAELKADMKVVKQTLLEVVVKLTVLTEQVVAHGKILEILLKRTEHLA